MNRTGLLIAVVAVMWPVHAAAQAPVGTTHGTGAFRPYVTVSGTLQETSSATPDGYFGVSGDNGGFATGLSVAVGGQVSGNVSIEGEVLASTAISGPAAASMRMSGSTGFTASERATMVSLAVRRRMPAGSDVGFEPLVGLAVVASHQMKTQVVSQEFADPTVGQAEPDSDRCLYRPGLVLGLDYVLSIRSRLSFVAGARVYVLPREHVDTDFIFPPQGGVTVRGNIGVRLNLTRDR